MKPFVLACVACWLAFGTASAQSLPKLSVALPDVAVDPAVSTPGRGSADLTLDEAMDTLEIRVRFQDYDKKPVSVRLNCCVDFAGFATWATRSFTTITFAPAGSNDGYLLDKVSTLDSTTWTSSFSSALTPKQAEKKLADALRNGQAYVVIYTEDHKEDQYATNGKTGGALRGFFPKP